MRYLSFLNIEKSLRILENQFKPEIILKNSQNYSKIQFENLQRSWKIHFKKHFKNPLKFSKINFFNLFWFVLGRSAMWSCRQWATMRRAFVSWTKCTTRPPNRLLRTSLKNAHSRSVIVTFWRRQNCALNGGVWRGSIAERLGPIAGLLITFKRS